MGVNTVIVLILLAAGGSFIQRVTGFGFGIFMMTVLPYLMPSYGEATALCGLLAVATVSVTAIAYLKYTPWKKLWPILLTFLAFSFFAVAAVTRIDDSMMKKVLGAILILVSLYFFFVKERIRMRPTVPVQVGMGSLSGIMGGLFAMQGPPAVIYFVACTDTKDEYQAICSLYFIIGNIAMSVFRAGNGLVTAAVGRAWLYAVPGLVIGHWLGTLVYRKMNITGIRRTVYAYMAVAGVLALIG